MLRPLVRVSIFAIGASAMCGVGPSAARADEPKPAPTLPRVWSADDVLHDEALHPGDRRKRAYLAHGEAMSASVSLQEQTFPFHCHPQHDEVLSTIRGEGRFRLGAKILHVKAGDIVWIPRDVIHGVVDGSLSFLLVTAPSESELYPDTTWATDAPFDGITTCNDFYGAGGARTRQVRLAQTTRPPTRTGLSEPTTHGEPLPEKGASGIPLKIASDYTATLYGFVELDTIFDTTRSFDDLAGNAVVTRPAPDGAPLRPRLQFSVRNSRFGFRVQAPRLVGGLLVSGTLEGDFFGASSAPTESVAFSSPGFRLRHAFVRAELRPLYVVLGQSWNLFGWQPYYFPAGLGLQGLIGEAYGRNAQVRIGTLLTAGRHEVDISVAAVRPLERDSGTPDAHAGIRWSWTGLRAGKSWGATSTGLEPLSLAVSGIYRRVSIPLGPTSFDTDSYGAAAAVFLPLVASFDDRRENTLSLTAQATYGVGIADQFTKFSTGAPQSASAVEPGVVATLTAAEGGGVELVRAMTGDASLEYYLPPHGRVLFALGAGAVILPRASAYAGADVYNANLRGSATLLWEVSDWFRLGIEGVHTLTRYADAQAANERVQATSLFIF